VQTRQGLQAENRTLAEGNNQLQQENDRLTRKKQELEESNTELLTRSRRLPAERTVTGKAPQGQGGGSRPAPGASEAEEKQLNDLLLKVEQMHRDASDQKSRLGVAEDGGRGLASALRDAHSRLDGLAGELAEMRKWRERGIGDLDSLKSQITAALGRRPESPSGRGRQDDELKGILSEVDGVEEGQRAELAALAKTKRELTEAMERLSRLQ
jgi:chromosome segregation ATPase